MADDPGGKVDILLSMTLARSTGGRLGASRARNAIDACGFLASAIRLDFRQPLRL